MVQNEDIPDVCCRCKLLRACGCFKFATLLALRFPPAAAHGRLPMQEKEGRAPD